MALPYIDKEYDNEVVRDYVDRMIQAEMTGMGPRKAPEDAFLETEAPRLAAIDTLRFRLATPSGPASEAAWSDAVDNAHAQTQQQSRRLANLALMSSFSTNAWRVHVAQLLAEVEGVQRERDEVKNALLNLHAERKREQLAAKATLEKLDQKWSALVDSVLRVDIANYSLEQEIEALRTQ
ncbi:hypothetical protein HDU98_008140 [Podochytrium sp. JEL0797]|nr:hypothetical protein HDU98_008140 [Podochytrium sp. JEL0797]